MRFEEAAKDLVTDYTVNKKRTLVDLTRRVQAILTPCFRGRRLATIGTADVRAYVAQRQKAGAANASINLELANLKRMFTLAIQAGKVLQRPYIPMLKEDNVRKGFFERTQFEAVRRHLQAPLDRRRDAGLLHRLAHRQRDPAARVAPDRPRRPASSAWSRGRRRTATGARSSTPSSVEVAAAVEAPVGPPRGARGSRALSRPLVFCRGGGQAIKSFYTRWDQACTAAGCPGRIPHDFRRTAVRNLNRAGVPETVAMKITGHKTRSVFDRYDITSEEDLAEASRKLQALAGTIAGTIAAKRPLTRTVARLAGSLDVCVVRWW